MATYLYSARDQQGIVQTGRVDATGEEEVVSILQNRGLLVTSITPQDIAATARTLRRGQARKMHGRVTVGDQVLLCQQLATMIEAGVPLLKSLEVMLAQIESVSLLHALQDVHDEVEGGHTFRDGLAKHPEIFSKLWLNLVETGEASGHLAQSLQQLARHFESAYRLQSQAKTALTYPAFLVVVATVVLGVFVYWLIPKFSTMFAAMNIELPLITQIVVAISEAARHYVLVIIASIIGITYLLREYLKTVPGQWTRDQLLLHLPLFGSLIAHIQIAAFSRGLSTLLESGVPLLSGLEILENSAANRIYGAAIRHVREAVQEGKMMAGPMEETGAFPPMAVQMVQVGEEVGELGKMVGRMAHFYEEQVEAFVARMARLFEPIAIVLMGGMVLVIVLAIFMPIFKMATGGGIH